MRELCLTPLEMFPSRCLREDRVGTSDCNSYIPIYSLYAHTLLTFNDHKDIVLEYGFPKTGSYSYDYRTYRNLFNYLYEGTVVTRFYFKTGSDITEVFVYRGMLFDISGNILMCMAVNTEYILENRDRLSSIISNPDYSKFVVFVGKEMYNPIYKSLKKKVKELFINKVREAGLS